MKIIEKTLLILLVISSAFSQVEKEKTINEEKIIINKKEPVRFSKQMKGTFNGKRMNYLASHYETILYEKNNYNKPMASIFVTEYRSLNNDPNRLDTRLSSKILLIL